MGHLIIIFCPYQLQGHQSEYVGVRVGLVVHVQHVDAVRRLGKEMCVRFRSTYDSTV